VNKSRRRKSTGQWEWEAAKEVAKHWSAAEKWDERVTAPELKRERTTIEHATDAYLDWHRSHHIQKSSLNKYKTLTNLLLSFTGRKGIVFIDQLTISDMDAFYNSWKDAMRSRAKKLERLKSFVRFCLKRKWIAENIVEDLKAPHGSSIPADRLPFTDEELDRIRAACKKLKPIPPGPGYRPWSGQDVRDFFDLMLYSGLRISDAVALDIKKRLDGNNLYLRQHKTKKPVYTWIPTELADRLRAREAKHGPVIFKTGESMVNRTMTELWRLKLKKAFDLAGPWEAPPTSHRIRHTFARILLEKGVPVEDVATLMGDTPQVIVRFYAKWVGSRQARLSQILKEAFSNQATA
jgi:integrase